MFNKKLQRIEYRDITKREPTGIKLPIYPPAINAGSFKQYHIDDDAELKPARLFPALNKMAITNTGAVNIQIRLQNSDKSLYIIPANSLVVIDNIEYNFFDIKNLDSSSATVENKILIHAIYEDAQKVRF